MKYRTLGRSGFEVSDLAYGLWGMSGWSGSDDRESLASLQPLEYADLHRERVRSQSIAISLTVDGQAARKRCRLVFDPQEGFACA